MDKDNFIIPKNIPNLSVKDMFISKADMIRKRETLTTDYEKMAKQFEEYKKRIKAE